MNTILDKSLKRFDNLPDILNAKIISEYLDIGYVKALKLIQYGDVPYIKIGNTYRVTKQSFEQWLQSSNNRTVLIE